MCYITWPTPQVCPTCHRCPTCGQYNYPYTYAQPTITWRYDPYGAYPTTSGTGIDNTIPTPSNTGVK